GYGKVADVPVAAPRRVTVAPHTNVTGVQSVKIRHGPYKVPSMNKENMMGSSGTLYNYPDVQVERPWLEYPDGSPASVDNGMWLHHMVALNAGPGRMDPTCMGKMSLPHMVVGSNPATSERMYSSGNEGNFAMFSPPFAGAEKLGYFMEDTDKLSFIVDLMNQAPEDKTVYMTMTYDYLPATAGGGRPDGFGNIKAVWLDVNQCGTSEMAPPATDKYSLKADWTANFEGEILGMGGHLHDGGTNMVISVDGKTVCDSVATYSPVDGGGEAGAEGGGMASMGGMGGMVRRSIYDNFNAKVARDPPAPGAVEHISAMSGCAGPQLPIKTLKMGQKWTIQGNYDYTKHPGMKHADGKEEAVMAISMMYVKNPKLEAGSAPAEKSRCAK
ncbi:hypothetical protein LTS18_004554, partial [Coniosporium uncinatum]